MTRFCFLHLIGSACALCIGICLPAGAQPYPVRAVTLIVPQAAGGTNDIIARLMAQKLGENLGQSFIVDNRPGAGGNIGTAASARAAKDGYTLLLTISSAQAINPALYSNTGFDPVKDFEAVAAIASVPNLLVVHPSFPAQTLAEFIQITRSNPGKYQFASAGNGTLNHLLGEMLNSMAGIEVQHIPYKGVAPALNDLLGGHVPIAFASVPSVIAHVRSGKLRALGVSSAERNAALPEVPAISEAVPGYSGDLWVGLFAVAGTPRDIVATLNSAVNKALADKDLKEKFAALGAQLLGGTPEQLNTMLRSDMARWASVVKASGARLD